MPTLTVTRRSGERILIYVEDRLVTVELKKTSRGRAMISVTADEDVKILREELEREYGEPA